MFNFNEENLRNIELLKKYVPIVSRVHGKNHQEFYEVKVVFLHLIEKLDNDFYNLDNEFKQLKIITNNYLVPSDVCETYAEVYIILDALDKEYNKMK